MRKLEAIKQRLALWKKTGRYNEIEWDPREDIELLLKVVDAARRVVIQDPAGMETQDLLAARRVFALLDAEETQ